MKKFTVKRSKWLRGTGEGELLNKEGKMCCLGFAVNQICRIPKRDLLFQLAPNDVLPNKDTIFTDFCSLFKFPHNKPFIYEAMKINDDKCISDGAREASLTKIFEEAGIEVTFKD